jgi:hypothetical protein
MLWRRKLILQRRPRKKLRKQQKRLERIQQLMRMESIFRLLQRLKRKPDSSKRCLLLESKL